MKKRLILLFIWLPFVSNAQEIKQNNLYFEVAGASLFYSINYERLWLKNSEHNITTRLGIMYLYSFDVRERAIRGIPLSISYIKKLNSNYFEAGISFAIIRDSYNVFSQYGDVTAYEDELILMPSIRAGIRHQPSEKKLFWNILAQVSMTANGETARYEPYINFFPFISFGIGYSF